MGTASSPQVIGRYAIYGKIASGGMATVHFGRQLGGAGFSRTVAIKRLHPHLAEDPEVMSTMIDEGRMAARIHHPNVVPMLDVVSAEGELLLVMDYVRGESLARLIKIEAAALRPIPFSIVSAIVIGALHGLHAAHEATSDSGAPLGIIHRDMSPQNILVGVDGMARVIDFGVAKAAGRINTTQDGMIKGKLAYMAPEQLLGHALGRTADVYAMGVVLWEMLTGRRLVIGETDTAIMAQAFMGAKEAPSVHRPDVPPRLDRLVLKSLAPEPKDRFQTALEMAEMLLAVVSPAFPTDVGGWVTQAAHESLSKRGALLADIESESSGTLQPMPESDAAGLRPTRVGRSLATADTERVAELPTLTSHSASVGPPAPAPRQRPILAIIGGTTLGMVLALGVAFFFWPSTPAPVALDPAVASLPALTTAPPLQDPPAPMAPPARGDVQPIQVSPLPMTSPSPLPVPSPVPSPQPAAPPPPPAATHVSPPSIPHSQPVARTPVASPRAPSRPSPAAAAAAAPKSSCDPPYVIDSAGDRQYKPECL